MNTAYLHHLIEQALLQRPQPAEDRPALSDQRLLTLLRGQDQAQDPERRLLRQSPATRQRLLRLRELERAAAYRALARTGTAAAPLRRLAADDEAVRPYHRQERGYRLDIRPLDLEGRQWKIYLALDRQTAQALDATGVQLVDDGGRVWLRGRVDAQGRLDALWGHDDSPLARLKAHALHLGPA